MTAHSVQTGCPWGAAFFASRLQNSQMPGLPWGSQGSIELRASSRRPQALSPRKEPRSSPRTWTPPLPLDPIPHRTQTLWEGFSPPAGLALMKRTVLPSPRPQPTPHLYASPFLDQISQLLIERERQPHKFTLKKVITRKSWETFSRRHDRAHLGPWEISVSGDGRDTRPGKGAQQSLHVSRIPVQTSGPGHRAPPRQLLRPPPPPRHRSRWPHCAPTQEEEAILILIIGI